MSMITVNGETFERPERLSTFECMMWATIFNDTMYARLTAVLRPVQGVIEVAPWVDFYPLRLEAARLADLVVYSYRQGGSRIAL